MLIPQAVWHRVFAGVGKSYAAIRQSREFRTLLRREESLKSAYRRDSCEGIALRLGHLEYGALVNPFAPSAPTAEQLRAVHSSEVMSSYDAADRTAMRLFGDELVDFAKNSLPVDFPALAAHWSRSQSPKTQKEIAQQICEALRMPNPTTFLEDMCDQPPERVLPFWYQYWQRPDAVRPNCLGKTQMLAAFFKLAQARTFIGVPFSSTSQEVNFFIAELCAKLLNGLLESGNSATYDMLGSYLDWKLREATKIFDRPSYMHACVVVQLRDKSWLLCDPNYHLVTELPSGFCMPEMSGRIEALDGLLPGIAFSRESPHLAEILHKEDRRRQIDAAVSFEKTAARMHFRPRQGRDFLARSALLREIRKSATDAFQGMDEAAKKKREEERTIKGPLSDIQAAKAALVATTLPTDATVADIEKKVLDAQVWREITAAIVDKTFAEQIHAFLCIMLAEIAMNVAKAEHCPSSLFEFGNLPYQLALHTLRHVSLDMGFGENTGESLLEHGFGQFFLNDALIQDIDNSSGNGSRARRAREILEALPHRLRSADVLLATERRSKHVA